MSRYVTKPKPKASDGADAPQASPLPHPQVFVADPIKTGLVDKDGHDLYRLPDPVGFVRWQDSE